jgi:hypothetical protein
MKIRKLLLTFALLFSASIFAQSPANGGFENGVINAVTDWAAPLVSGTSTVTTTNARTGTYALAVTTSSNAINQDNINATIISVPDTWYGHAIGWARGSNANSRAQMRGNLNGVNVTGTLTAVSALNNILLQLTVSSGQNNNGGPRNFVVRGVTARTSANTVATTVYWDDIIMYTSASATPDLTAPVAPTLFTTGATLASSVNFSWTNGSDAATGIQNTIILRTTNLGAVTPVMNDQGVYSTSGGANGPNTVSTDWTVVSTSVSAATTSFTDNTVVAGTTYRYAVIHRDLAYNYSAALVGVITSSPSITSTTTGGLWSVGSTWVGGVAPTSSSDVIIDSGATVTLDAAVTRNDGFNTTVRTGATLATGGFAYTNSGTTTVNGTFQLDASGSVTGNNFVYGAASTLALNTTVTVVNTDLYWPSSNSPNNVNVLSGGLTMNAARTVAGVFQTAAGVTLSSTLTLNGTCQINAGGFFNNSPIYGASSLLRYNSGGTYSRGFEWLANGVGTIGTTAGYPNNVQLSNNTTFDYNNGNPANKAMNGSLTIDSGSTFNMTDTTNGPPSAGTLTIAGSVINNGTFTFANVATPVVVAGNYTNAGTTTMGSVSGADLRVGGDFTNTGTFNGNARAVFFTKTGTQVVTSSSTLTIPYLVTTGTGTIVQLATGTNLILSAPNTGNAVSFGNLNDVIDINGNSLTIGTAAIANVINGSGTFKGSTNSNLTLLGTGSIGTLNFTSGSQNLGTFTMNRQSSVVGCVLGSALTVNTSLVLTNGLIDLGTNNLTLGASATTTLNATPSNSFVLAFGTTGGQLIKTFTAAGNFTFPIGDNTSGLDYSPATFTFTGGTYAGTVGVRVVDAIHPSNVGATHYLTRYWQVSASGVTPTDYTFAGTYASSGDITGTEANCFPARNDGTNWIDIGGSSIASNTCTVSGTTFPSAANDFSAGSAYPEINIKGVVGSNPNILSGHVTPSSLDNTLFAATNVGSIQTKTFRIESLGVLPLSVASITLSNSTDFTVTASASYTISGGSFVDFTISFNPTSLGILTSTVSIVSNDFTGGENPYTFTIQGNGTCAPTSNIITPTSGPVGTVVTVTAVSPYNLTGATATFNGVSATVASISSSQVTVVVPSGAVSGTLVTTNSLGCQASNAFTVINNLTTSCQGGSTVSDLFISEVTDATLGGLSYVEIYNGTASSILLSDYSLKVYNNGNTITPSSTTALSGVTLAPQGIYVVALGVASSPTTSNTCTLVNGGNGSLANQTSNASAINFTTGAHDYIGLYKNSSSSLIDSFGVFGSATWANVGIGDRGVNFNRKNTATVPKFAFAIADWNITDWLGTGPASCSTNDYSDIGIYNFLVGTPPTVTVNPSFTPTCVATSMTVAGTEGFAGGNSLAYQWYAVAPNSASWTAITDTGVYTGSTSATLNISDVSSLNGYQYYCQIRENSATCYSASNAVMITAIPSTTWQLGNTWSNGTPSTSRVAIINNNFDTSVSGSFEACSVTVNNGFTLDIKSGTYVSIINDLTVNSGGNLLVQNNGSLIMVNDSGVVTNNGNTQVYRTASGIRGYDYVYWSSPVFGQSIDNIYSSPTPGFKYRWNPLATNINSPTSSGNWQTASGAMLPATGYIVRGSSSFGMAATNITSVFTGKVNSGIVSPSITRGSYQGINYPGANSVTVTKFDDNWNLVGNPYPSSIKALDFLTFNTNIQGFVYLWTHGTAPVSNTNPFYDSFTYNYTANDYITYNGTATTSGPSGFNGYIASGQGFFVSMNDGVTGTQTVTFKNSMRDKTYNNSQFYRTMQTATEEKNRIWLDLIDSNNVPVRTVVGYVAEATLGLDRMYDAIKNIANENNIYSLAEDETLIIQGRPTPFDQNDQVPIGVTILSAGDYKIAIAAVDGLFEQGQPIFLEDKLLNIIHDLRLAPYSFSTTAGKFNDRFVLRYTNTALGNPDFGNIENSVIVAGNQGDLTIKSSIENIQEVTIYDVLGRQLFFSKEINNTNFVASNISMSQQTLIVKIKLENGITISRKIIL